MTVIAFPAVEPPFPHIITPLPDESLLSFMVRLDLVNGWPVGGVAKLLAVHATGWRSASATMWAAGTLWDLRRLARLSMNPYAAIEALTYLPEVRRAVADPEADIGALGNSGSLRFCRVCLATTGTILKFCFLPHIEICPLHEVRLASFCGRHGGSPYPPIADGDVIRCSGCGDTDLSVAARASTGPEIGLMRDVWRAWAFVLGWDRDDIRGRGYRTIRSVRRGYPLRNLGRTPALTQLVTVFLALQIEPSLIATLEERPARPCPNAACPRHVAAGPRDPLARPGAVEHHCNECGARYIGRRILLCFDSDHGGRYPSARAVRKAKRRLLRWREALAEVCRQDLLDGRRITVTGAFRRAHVPMNANLRATRLGLVALVRDAARRQRILEEREPRPFRTITMSEYRVLVDCALRARWDQLVRCATQGAIWPGYETPELGCWGGRDRRYDPKSGILDPVFTPAWAARQGQSAYDLRNAILARVPAKYARYSPLSGRWDDRVDVHRAGSVAGPVVTPSHYRLRPSDGISPDSLAFICGEWSPDWMTDPSFSDPAPPARPFG